MSDGFVLAAIIAVVVAALFVPFRLPVRKRPKKRHLSTFGSVLGAINEIYLPSAHKSGQIVEEQTLARKPIPGAPDPFEKAKPPTKPSAN